MGTVYRPIICVRGFALTDSEKQESVATPYMGFKPGFDEGSSELGPPHHPPRVRVAAGATRERPRLSGHLFAGLGVRWSDVEAPHCHLSILSLGIKKGEQQ